MVPTSDWHIPPIPPIPPLAHSSLLAPLGEGKLNPMKIRREVGDGELVVVQIDGFVGAHSASEDTVADGSQGPTRGLGVSVFVRVS